MSEHYNIVHQAATIHDVLEVKNAQIEFLIDVIEEEKNVFGDFLHEELSLD